MAGGLESYARMAGFDFNDRRFKRTATGRRMATLTRFYSMKITEMALARFRWVGMPDEVDQRYLEWVLLNSGLAVFTRQSSLGNRFFALQATPERGYNHYFNPTRVLALGASGTPRLSLRTGRPTNAYDIANFKMDDYGVPIWGNLNRMPETDVISIYAEQMAQISRSIEINVIQTRNPYILAVPESQKLAAINVLNSLYDGDAAVMTYDSMDISNMVQVMQTGQDKSDVLLNNILAKQKIWNEAMNMLGINNANQDKKERLVSAEVEANDDQILLIRNSAIAARQMACDTINRDYNLSVKCAWRWHPDSDRPDGGTDQLPAAKVGMDAEPSASTTEKDNSNG